MKKKYLYTYIYIYTFTSIYNILSIVECWHKKYFKLDKIMIKKKKQLLIMNLYLYKYYNKCICVFIQLENF